jgi:hypothetical protein
MVRQRHLTRHRHLTAADQPDSRQGLVGGAKWPGGDQGHAPVGEVGDAMNTGGVEGFGQGHRRQDGGDAAGQPRLPRPRRAQEEDVMVRTPASASAL